MKIEFVEIIELSNIYDSLIITSVDCERGLSIMSLLKTKLKNKMKL